MKSGTGSVDYAKANINQRSASVPEHDNAHMELGTGRADAVPHDGRIFCTSSKPRATKFKAVGESPGANYGIAFPKGAATSCVRK
ncbi:hypothetical protein MJ575_09845 [Klebsiella pneumoniae]|nr:hypothetical protein MJ575_09845 [Klebsiella pneumoniae]